MFTPTLCVHFMERHVKYEGSWQVSGRDWVNSPLALVGWCEQQCNKKDMLAGSRGLHSLLELAWQRYLISIELLPEVHRFGTRKEIVEKWDDWEWHQCDGVIWGRLSGSYSKGRNALSRTPPSGRWTESKHQSGWCDEPLNLNQKMLSFENARSVRHSCSWKPTYPSAIWRQEELARLDLRK